MRARERRTRLAPGISEEFERPTRGYRRVQLAQRAGRGVTRIGENRFSGRRALLVQRKETGALQIHLAAYLDQLGPTLAGKHFRHGVERAQVRGDVFARGAVAARRPQRETAVPIRERDG